MLTQMVCYHVYVPLLLRLSNDVGENPGPVNINEIVDRTHTVHADFHQGNELMFGSNAGKQCVAMPLCSIAYNEIKSVNIWDPSIMNQILYYGNNLYSVVSQSLNQDFLLLTEVPELVDIENDTFHLQYSESFSGALFMTVNNDPYVTLEHAFNEIFFTTNYKSCLLTIGMNTVAIIIPFPDVFKIFYSYSRDLHGMPCASGYCVLTSVEGVQNLVFYFQLTSCNQNVYIPFELKGVICNKSVDLLNERLQVIVQDKSKSDLKKRKKCTWKTNYRNTLRQAESSEKKESRLAKEREYKRAQRKNESSEQREERLAKVRTYVRDQRKNESSEQREERLAKKRAYMKDKRKNESLEEKEKRLAKKRTYRKLLKESKGSSTNRGSSSQVSPPSVNNMTELIKNFHNSISTGPLYVFTCCEQLWYKHSVCPADRIRLVNPDVAKYLQNFKSVDNVEWLCNTCSNHLRKGKVPPCAIANGMKFPEKPNFFDINELECRLIAPRLAFQKIFQAPRGRQLKITGNVVNVPADVTNTVIMLPRLSHETGTIKVQLKRRLQYKSSALSLNVRLNKVMQAASWLVNTSALYQEQGITLDENWMTSIESETDSGVHNNENSNGSDDQTTPEDDWSEDEVEIPAGVTDSMLTAPDFVDDNERQSIYNFAPAEGNRPLSIFNDQYSEEMAYPGIFLGQKRPDDKQRLKSVYYSEICKSELRQFDRRAATCVENIFFKAKKLQMKLLLGQSQIALRKCKLGNRTLTAGQLKTPEGLGTLIYHDDGYKFLRALRGSPPYFEKVKKDLFAMISQLGPASLFCSFSSAETKWIHLLRILGKLIDHKDYSDEELDNLTWEEKCRLIQSDPVTCARHFDYQFNTFLKSFLMSDIWSFR